MSLTDIAGMSRKERADRTFQRQVYDRLVRLNRAIWEAKKAEADIGVTGELDIKNLIADIRKVGGIQWTSEDEKWSHKLMPPAVDVEAVIEPEDDTL